jgi:hypothetical protein
MADQFEEFSGALAPELLARAYRIPGELAWARADAIEAIDALEKDGFTILGVEVWLPTSPGPTMTGRYWDPDIEGVEDPALTAHDFVRNFRWGRFDESLKRQRAVFQSDSCGEGGLRPSRAQGIDLSRAARWAMPANPSNSGHRNKKRTFS